MPKRHQNQVVSDRKMFIIMISVCTSTWFAFLPLRMQGRSWHGFFIRVDESLKAS